MSQIKMGCDFYTQEQVTVTLKDGTVLIWDRQFPCVKNWFPDDIYRHVDSSNEEEITRAGDEYIASYSKRNDEVVWTEGQELRSLYKRVLKDLDVSVEDVRQIHRTTVAWRRT